MGQFGLILGVGVIMEFSRRDDLTRPEALATTTVPVTHPAEDLAPGRTLGARYRITSLLGRGGMGEVWLAHDLKLQVDVALKSIRAERFPGEQGLELLRREVRAAREVMSPNVCRIFDLVDEEGREFVSMEYIDGLTLLQILRDRGPLDLQEATRISSQFLAGLEAIHQAGLVHRDVKPENIMITRTGRVVLMDFGVAKGMAEDARGTIAGTPAYMAPEQLQGQALDARADIFAAGVVLAEMIAPEGVRDRDSRESVWALVRQEPPRLFDGPWRAVLERAVAGDREQRYASAHQLARALEEVTLRVEGAEDKRPYPGLESFTEADAEFFFGREVEVEAVWKKLQRANLLAIIGPSGAGKTSFVQAGLIRARPADWRHVACRPGAAPFAALAQALVGDLAGDADAMRALLQIENPEQALAVTSRWRAKHPQALLVVDQFEELFTLCPSEVQAKFADLLGRLAAEADVHVLLVLRDDFLFRCHEHPALSPVTSDLTMLGPPTGNSLRRALVQPALLCGYRLEDESLADEMLAAIEGERGALPLLAFAAARLWEHRDRERGLLTRQAYDGIGGVSGALAQHAEATLERIGADRQPMVREVFRNLVTAQGTRATTEVDELLSVFPNREAATSVLRQLVDARLLTSFEVHASPESERARNRVEIVHESLLTSWPRLVRWQAQDTEGALLRDQLRQQARLWEERKRPDDLLWTGSSYREFAVWRERYPGGLTAVEEAFAQAMVARAERQRLRRRLAWTAAFTALVALVLVIGWYARGERTARLSAEVSKLETLGRVELATDPTAALAYATAALELADTPAMRRFALEALSSGPIAFYMPFQTSGLTALTLEFSRDESRLATGGFDGVQILHRDGSAPTILEKYIPTMLRPRFPMFASDDDHVVWQDILNTASAWRWSASGGKETRTFQGVYSPGFPSMVLRGTRCFFLSRPLGSTDIELLSCGWDDETPIRVGRWPPGAVNPWGLSGVEIDPGGRWMAYAQDRGVYVGSLEHLDVGRGRLLGEHAGRVDGVQFDPSGTLLASSDTTGEIRLWSLAGDSPAPLRVLPGPRPVGIWGHGFDSAGTVLAVAYDVPENVVHLWDLSGPRDAEPVVLRTGLKKNFPFFDVAPSGQWIAAANDQCLTFWPRGHAYPYILRSKDVQQTLKACAFTPDSRSLIGSTVEGLRVWSLEGEPTRHLGDLTWARNIALDPDGHFVVVATQLSGLFLVTLPEGQTRQLSAFPSGGDFAAMALSHDGKLIAACRYTGDDFRIRILDLESETFRDLESPKDKSWISLRFAPDGTLFSSDLEGSLVRWDAHTGSRSVVANGKGKTWIEAISRDSRFLYTLESLYASGDSLAEDRSFALRIHDLMTRSIRAVTTHGNRVFYLALDQAESVLVTSDLDGVVRVGPVTGEEPHILLGPKEGGAVAVSPDGRWIAAADAQEPALYIWPTPHGTPFHTLPHREFLDRLRSLTNRRVVPDGTSRTGYRLDTDPFPGWETVPSW